MAPPPSFVVSPVISLIVRILTLICLIISLILLTTATGSASVTDYDNIKFKFKDFKAFRYLCAATVIGLAYALLQTAFTVSLVCTGNRVGGHAFIYLDFYGDKVASYLLATGGAASFGMTQDFKDLADIIGITDFIDLTNAAASLCLLGFVFTAVSSVFSSFALPKRS